MFIWQVPDGIFVSTLIFLTTIYYGWLRLIDTPSDIMLLVQTIIAWLHVFSDTIISRNDALFASIPSFSYKYFKAPFPLGSIKHGTAWNSLSYPLFFQIEAHASLTIYCFISTFQWTVFIQNLMECACIGIIYEFSPAFKRINFLLSTDGIFVVVQQST